MNDDNPIIRFIDGEPYIYGSPWSGKTPCYRNVKAKLGAITRIDRDSSNWVERLSPIEALRLSPSLLFEHEMGSGYFQRHLQYDYPTGGDLQHLHSSLPAQPGGCRSL